MSAGPSIAKRVRALLRQQPSYTNRELAAATGATPKYINKIRERIAGRNIYTTPWRDRSPQVVAFYYARQKAKRAAKRAARRSPQPVQAFLQMETPPC